MVVIIIKGGRVSLNLAPEHWSVVDNGLERLAIKSCKKTLAILLN